MCAVMRFVIPVFALLGLVTGCAGSINVVEDARSGGTVALHGSEDSAREKAEDGGRTRTRCCQDGSASAYTGG